MVSQPRRAAAAAAAAVAAAGAEDGEDDGGAGPSGADAEGGGGRGGRGRLTNGNDDQSITKVWGRGAGCGGQKVLCSVSGDGEPALATAGAAAGAKDG